MASNDVNYPIEGLLDDTEYTFEIEDTVLYADLTPGTQGEDGVGVPPGGNEGQVLAKNSNANYDTEWVDAETGGGDVISVNGQNGIVVLDAEDVGADPQGSAATAEANAKTYTDQEVSSLDGELAVVAKTGSYNDLLDKPTIPNITGKADITYVDAQDASLHSNINAKVDKVSGKQLSTEDYTSAEKTKLIGIETSAQVNTVTSVNTKVGEVVLNPNDIGAGIPAQQTIYNANPAGAPGSTQLSTWTKPAGAKMVHFWGYAAGGGGGSGATRATTSNASGGGGGGTGAFFDVTLPAHLVPATMSVNVGRGGAGGAARSTPDTDGQGGGGGGVTGVTGGVGYRIAANSGTGGGGGTSVAATAGRGEWGWSQIAGVSGGGGSLSAGGRGGSSSNVYGPQATGGGGGGGLGANNTASYAGGPGGENNNLNVNPGGAAGLANGGNGGDGRPVLTAGIGGGGGGSSTTSNAGNGGDSSGYAAGGGGGGATRNGFISGAGGKGSDGIVIITVYF